MAISTSTLSSILRVKKEFNTDTGEITLTDLTDWSGNGIIAPDTAKVLLKLVAPTGATVYINPGFDTDNYVAPDFTLLVSDISSTMPTDVNGEYITGTYTLYIKASVLDGVVTVRGSATTTSEVCDCSSAISIDLTADYATALLTSADITAYGSYFSLSRVHTIYPPPISGLSSQTTGAATNIYSNIVTTTWSSKIVSTVVYLKANDTYVTCVLTGTKEIDVEADTLCATLCLVKKFRSDFYSKFGKKCSDDMERAYNLAIDEFTLAMQASRCGQDITPYINKIYEITGLDPDCDCDCNPSDYPTPVVPTSIINGVDGTDGVTPIFQNTGLYIQVSYDSGISWNNLILLSSIAGANGANGTNGTNGADGVAVLHNDLTSDTSSNAGVETLKTFTLDADQLATNGDIIEIRARFTSVNKNAGITAGSCNVYLDGTKLSESSVIYSIQGAYHTVRVSRTAPATGKSDVRVEPALKIGAYLFFDSAPISTLSSISPTWANPLDIDIIVDDNGGEPVTCDLFQVTYYKK